MKHSITSISAREIIDSRGNPTVEAKVIIEKKVNKRDSNSKRSETTRKKTKIAEYKRE